MTALLWTLAALGAWNALNLVARIVYGEPCYRYWPSIFFGAWAAILLVMR